MNCKICGHRSNSLPAMRKHYSKKHPGALKHHSRKSAARQSVALQKTAGNLHFCPNCGAELNPCYGRSG